MRPKNIGKEPPGGEKVLGELVTEAGLSEGEARVYFRLLSEGRIASSDRSIEVEKLLDRGMAIVSGDGGSIIPVHPRLGIANYYRSWRESMVREINERRMRVDKLIIELIPVYEAAMEKRSGRRAG
jgi:hypothetical protein